MRISFTTKVCKRIDGCHWCSEPLVLGEEYVQVTEITPDQELPARRKLHSECCDAWDNALYHGDFILEGGENERGEFPCPSGQVCCGVCRDTPFRRLLRGDKKPALAALYD